MIFKINSLYNSKEFADLYGRVYQTILRYNMDELLSNGAVLGFSGGPDSVMLLLILRKYYDERNAVSNLTAVHVNHLIRGEEAYRDEFFSKDICNALDVDFISEKIDVPAISKETGLGIEETARNARYSCFSNIIKGRNPKQGIAIAHNSTDNLETVLFNMIRGSGLSGISGISPVRDNIVRPLIEISKKEITELLDKFDIPYVTDSTNSDTEYTRNYIRHEIVPRLSRLSERPEEAVSRLSRNLRMDSDFIESEVNAFLKNRMREDGMSQNELVSLHPALLSRVIIKMAGDECSLSSIHIKKITELLEKGEDFKFSLPSGKTFLCERRTVNVIGSDIVSIAEPVPLSVGFNNIIGFSDAILLSYDKPEGEYRDSSLNVYKISIQQSIASDIINDGLYLRGRVNGDSYIYGGITHKIKKLFIDKKIPNRYKDTVPVICDKNGIVWVPSFGVRDGARPSDERRLWISVLYSQSKNGKHFYIPSFANIK